VITLSENSKEIREISTLKNGISKYEIKGGKIAFKNKQEFLEAFDEFKANRLGEILLTSGIQGNRAGLNARIEVITQFFHEGNNKADFIRMCALRGYSQERREEIWNDLEQVWIPEFKKSLIQVETKKDNEEFVI